MIPFRLPCGFLALATLLAASEPIRPKVIVVATFEVGADTGDKPGEFQFWAEREHLDGSMQVSGVDHPVRFNDEGVYGVVSGTTSRAGLQIMALCLDPHFDLTHTYWLINGIAGVNPNVASEGSAAWAQHVIDGDIAFEIDTREAPADWPYGIMSMGNHTPLEKPEIPDWAPKPMAWTMNPALVAWAYGMTKDIALVDSPAGQAHRAQYTTFPEAQKPPHVLLGDSFGSCRYWHGARMQKWAEDWTKLYTHGEGICAMTDMEDQGIAEALYRLDKMGRVDFQRVLFLRTGSNFSEPPAGRSVAENMVADYVGGPAALEAAYRAGSPVVHAIVKDWATFVHEPPK
ncbi:MAG TPA: purine nucleoside permease [Opitutus sp.]|nr:purine nucleoside permease [Opitutus sp.]